VREGAARTGVNIRPRPRRRRSGTLVDQGSRRIAIAELERQEVISRGIDLEFRQ
jgi:hypothetical protein